MNQKPDDKVAYWWKCVKLIQDNIDQFKTIRATLTYPNTIDEVMRFMLDASNERLSLNDLPNVTRKDRDLRKLLVLLDMENHPRKLQLDAFYQSKEDLSHVSVVESYRSYAGLNMIKHLSDSGAKEIKLDRYTSTYQAYSAKNIRTEAHSVIQNIASDSIPYNDTVIVCLDKSSLEPLTSYCDYLKIPYSSLNDTPIIQSRYMCNLLDLTENPTMDSLSSLIKSGLIKDSNLLSLIKYIDIFKPEYTDFFLPFTHMKDKADDFELINKKTIQMFKHYESHSEKIRLKLLPILETLKSIQDESTSEKLKACFSILTQHCVLNDDGIDALYMIQDYLAQCLPYVDTVLEPLSYIKYQLKNLKRRSKLSGGLLITNLTHAMIPNKKKLIVMGCTQNNYPQYPSHTGFFDEAYYAYLYKDTGSERYKAHITQIESLFTLYPQVVFSYASGNYEGKGQQASFEIERYLADQKIKLFTPWPLVENQSIQYKEEKLSKDLALALYFKDKVLNGSVSSFETFFSCPYQYFMQRGMKLDEGPSAFIDSSMMGNIQHKLLELCFEQDNPYDSQKLSSNLNNVFEPFKLIYPKDSAKLDVILKRTEIQLYQVLKSLKEIADYSKYKTHETEVKYDHTYVLADNSKVHLTGRIDRVDKTNEYYRIIDYKSSDKTIKAETVLSGNQLQLSTYACLYEGLPQHAPAGAYYYNVSQSNIKIGFLDYAMTKGITAQDPSKWTSNWIKNHKMKGMTFDNAKDLDINGEHITHIRKKTEGDSYVLEKDRYNIDTLNDVLRELYTYLYEKLSSGTIGKDPVSGACTYCDYKGLCQYHKDQSSPISKVNISKINYEKDPE